MLYCRVLHPPEVLEVVRVAAHPAASVGERLAAVTDDRTAAVMTSTVFFNSAHIAGDLTPGVVPEPQVAAGRVPDRGLIA